MKYPFLIAAVVCLLGVSSCTWRFTPGVNEFFFEAADLDEVTYPNINVDSLQQAYPNSPAVMLGATTSIEHGFGFLEPLSSRVVRATRLVVLDPNDAGIGVIAESFYQTITVADIDVVVLHPDGTRYQRSLNDFTRTGRDLRYYLRLQLEDLRRGSIIDVAFHLQGDRRNRFTFEEPIYRSWKYPCLVERLECFYPMSEKLVTKRIPTKLTATTIVDEPGHFISESKNTAGIQWEPYGPPNAYLNSHFQWETYDPSDAHDLGSYWYTARESYDPLFKYARYSAIDEEDLEMTKEIAFTNDSTRLDSLQSVADWFRSRFKRNDNTIYISSVPMCLKSRHGSEIELSVILREVCRSFKWPAEIGVVHQSLRGPFDSLFYSTTQMNEYVVAVGDTSALALVFFLRKDQPVNVVPTEYVGQPIFYLTPERDEPPSPPYDTVSRVVNVPATFHRDYKIALNQDGSALVTSTFTYEGTWAVEQREEWKAMTRDQIESDIHDSFVFDQVETRDVKITTVNESEPLKPLVINVSYTIPLALSNAGSTSIFQTAGLARSVTEQALRIDAQRRVNPIVLHERSTNQTSLECTFPPGWQLQCELASASVKNAMGTMERNVQRTSGSLSMNARTTLEQGWFPPTAATDLRSLLGERSHHDIPTLVFTSTR